MFIMITIYENEVCYLSHYLFACCELSADRLSLTGVLYIFRQGSRG